MSPDGLIYHPQFVPPHLREEVDNFLHTATFGELPGRKVLQYGKLYDYKVRNLTLTMPPIPETLQKLTALLPEQNLTQCIVNRYLPGEGIAPHIDSQDFGSRIYCFTFGSPVTLDFTKEGEVSHSFRPDVYSLYIMTSEARYLWKHGIAKRKTDTVNGQKVKRGTRYSITFRSVLSYFTPTNSISQCENFHTNTFQLNSFKESYEQ